MDLTYEQEDYILEGGLEKWRMKHVENDTTR
jgi:hypothetical protein